MNKLLFLLHIELCHELLRRAADENNLQFSTMALKYKNPTRVRTALDLGKLKVDKNAPGSKLMIIGLYALSWAYPRATWSLMRLLQVQVAATSAVYYSITPTVSARLVLWAGALHQWPE